MARRDGTGPLGMGPMTVRGFGSISCFHIDLFNKYLC